jgi:hypothetical protein
MTVELLLNRRVVWTATVVFVLTVPLLKRGAAAIELLTTDWLFGTTIISDAIGAIVYDSENDVKMLVLRLEMLELDVVVLLPASTDVSFMVLVAVAVSEVVLADIDVVLAFVEEVVVFSHADNKRKHIALLKILMTAVLEGKYLTMGRFRYNIQKESP